jgi:ABC-2 type transport system ATP-binding protein
VDVELRRLLWDYVRELHAKGTTIILTTHYLEEAEELCDSIAIVNHGEIVACEPTPKLLSRLDYKTLIIEPREPLTEIPAELAMHDAKLRPDGTLAITFKTAETGIGRLLEKARAAGISVADLSTKSPDLEDVFLALTSDQASATATG